MDAADILNDTEETHMSQSNDDSFQDINASGRVPRIESVLTTTHDDTIRSKVYQFLSKVYVAIWLFLSRATNHATIHSTKFSLLVLFFVTAFQPSVFNGILFIMFLLLSMANNS